MKIDSPCIGICKLDSTGRYCLGCFRLVEEISGWQQFSNEQKIKIMDKIKVRKNE
jgi:predicted Fe-S protein YdhL (DUF1289 family)